MLNKERRFEIYWLYQSSLQNDYINVFNLKGGKE